MMQDLFPNELSLWLRRGAILIDVREPVEFAAGHIAGSVNIPLGQLPERMETLHPPLVLVCASGNRSSTAAELLADWGMSEVGNLMGGIYAYTQQGYPLELNPENP